MNIKKYHGIVYRGINYVTPVSVEVEHICDSGIGRIDCIECEGTGYWPYGPAPEECGPCVECKGTGKVFINSFPPKIILKHFGDYDRMSEKIENQPEKL